MKKTLLTLAVASLAASPIAAQANALLYGSMRLVVESTSHEDAAQESDTSINSTGSRFGLRGFEELGNGLKIGARYEFAVSADKATIDDNNRLAYVSVEGNFGQFQVGQVWSSYWNIVGNGWPAIDFSGDGLGDVTTFRLPDSIKWAKSMGAVSISALAQFEDGFQRAQGSLEYKVAGFSIGLGFDQLVDESSLTTNTDKDNNAEDNTSLGLSLGYAMDNGLALTAILASDDNGVDDAINSYNLNAVYSANHNTFIVSFGDNNTDADGDESYSLELARKLGERSTAWVGFESSDPSTRVQLGLRHNW